MRIRRVLTVTVFALIAVSCDGSPSGVDDESGDLDCLRGGYPCTLGEVPEAVMAASLNALEDGYEALATGDIAGARAVLEERADLAEIHSDDYAIRFRLEGGAPVWLLDVRGLTPDDAAGAAEGQEFSEWTTAKSVVGEDSNGDGKVDNRDVKRALVMAPYRWQFQPWDESPLLAEILGELEAYEGNVRYVENETSVAQNVTLDDWMSWGDYDAVLVSTHGMRVRTSDGYLVVISSGVEFDLSQYDTNRGGVVPLGKVDESQGMSNLVVEYGLAADFFRVAYPDGLDDALVSFSACETGGGGASELADALSGEDFVMMGWTETVPSDVAFTALGGFVGSLRLGIRAEEALDQIREQGLDRGVNSAGDLAVFTRFAPDGGDQRLIEVPSILDRTGRPMTDGENLTASLDGIPGDGAPDRLVLEVRLDGVEEGTEDDYSVRYRLDEQDARGSYSLADATRLDESAVSVKHDVDLGRDAPTEPAELEAIADLPEGSESRFAVSVQFAACSFDVNVSGDFTGTFDGAARVSRFAGDAIGIDLQSRGFINGATGPESFIATAGTGPGATSPDTYEITGASAAQGNISGTSVFSASYLPGHDPADCTGCGGDLILESVSDDAVIGAFSVTMPVTTPHPGGDADPYIVTLDATFTAVEEGDPFTECKIKYADD